MSLARVREKYPEFAAMSDQQLADSLYKSHYKGKMSKEDYYKKLGMDVQPTQSNQKQGGLEGIGEDVLSSIQSSPEALFDMVSSIPGGIKNVAEYSTTHNPLKTAANLGVGGGEAIAGLASSPQVLMRYLAEKFPKFGKRLEESAQDFGGKSLQDPTFYESLMNFEKQHGMAPSTEEEASVRSAGGLLGGAGVLKKLGSVLARTGTIAAEQAGRGGDPVHAAILGVTGEMVGRSPWVKEKARQMPQATADVIKSIPEATASAVKAIPEVAGKTAASVLESTADLASEIPMAGKFIAPVAQPTVGALASYLKHISVAPEELAKRNLFADIEPAELSEMVERDAAGKRLGLTYLTPSELLDSPFESVKQASVGRTTKGMKLLYKLGKERESSEASAINKLLDLIHEDKLDPVKKAAYEDTMSRSVPEEFIEKQIKNPAIQKAMNRVKNNTAFKQLLFDEYGISDIDQIPKNSFMYWDFVKRALYDLESKSGRGGGKTEPTVYSNIRNRMVNDLDKIAPQYKTARNIAERKFTREKLENVFDKKDKNFNNFDSFLKSKENFDDIMNKLDAFPEAKQQLADIEKFSGKMIPNNPTTRAAAALKRLGMSDARNALEAKKREFDEKYGQEHDVAAVRLMTNPDLMKILIEHLKKKGK